MGTVLVLTKRSAEIGRKIDVRQLTRLILRTPLQGLASLDAGFFLRAPGNTSHNMTSVCSSKFDESLDATPS